MSANLVDRSLFRAYIKVGDKYYVVGKMAGEGTLSFGVTQEDNASITEVEATKTAKAGTFSLPISTKLDIGDKVSLELLLNTLRKNYNKQYEVLLVYEFLSVKGQKDHYIAQKFNAIIPLESLGGSGQTPNMINFTIGNAGGVQLGSVDASSDGSKYDAGADTYTADAFTAKEDVEIEGDPSTVLALDVKAISKKTNSEDM